jgi:hypothetical protein
MAFKFERIMKATNEQLEQIIMEEDDEDRGFITAKDFMNDFATEDFITKNIRVRPHSGLAREGGQGEEGYSRIGAGESEWDNEKKENEIVRMELQNDREMQKTRLITYLQRKAEEEEKLLKKRR